MAETGWNEYGHARKSGTWVDELVCALDATGRFEIGVIRG